MVKVNLKKITGLDKISELDLFCELIHRFARGLYREGEITRLRSGAVSLCRPVVLHPILEGGFGVQRLGSAQMVSLKHHTMLPGSTLFECLLLETRSFEIKESRSRCNVRQNGLSFSLAHHLSLDLSL
eukprot:gene12281-biopygen3353